MWELVLGIFVVLFVIYMMKSGENFDTYGNTLEAAKFLRGPNPIMNEEIKNMPDVFLRYDWHNKDFYGLDVYDKLYEQWTQEKWNANKDYDLEKMVADYGATVSANPVTINTMGQTIRLVQKEF